MNRMNYRLRVKDFLEANNLTAYRLARKIQDVSPATIYAVVAGTRSPELRTLQAIHAALEEMLGHQIDLSELLEVVRS